MLWYELYPTIMACAAAGAVLIDRMCSVKTESLISPLDLRIMFLQMNTESISESPIAPKVRVWVRGKVIDLSAERKRRAKAKGGSD